jgi:hypothetical protein
MKTLRLITAIIMVVGLIGVFSAFSAEQTNQGKKEGIITDTQESKDKKKAPAPGSTTMKAPAAAVQSLPLIITRLYLKDGKVHVVIKKQGSKRLSDEDYANTKLKVETRKLKKPLEWTLLEVDTRKRLNRLRKEKDFNTGLAVTKARTRVTATLYKGLWKTAKQGTLSPKMAKVDVNTPAGTPEQKKGKTDQRFGPVSASRLPIEILTPSDGMVFNPGNTMHVRYRISTPTEAGEVIFRLYQDSTDVKVAEITHYYEPSDLSRVDWNEADMEPTGIGLGTGPVSMEPSEDDGEPLGIGDVVFAWTVPRGLPPVDDNLYYVKARKDNLLGTSATFRIEPPSEGVVGEGGFEGFVDVEVVYPNGGEHFINSMGTIRWRIVGNYDRAPGPWSIDLRGNEHEHHIESDCEDHEDSYGGAYPYRECSVHFIYRIAGTYTLRVSNGELSDESDAPFGIGISEEWRLIRVTAPTTTNGADITRGGNIPYRWESYDPMRCRAHLVKGDRIVDTNEASVFGVDSTTVGEYGFYSDTLEEGDDYKVRVENEANSANFAESRTFAVRDCAPNFVLSSVTIDHSNHIIATIHAGCSEDLPVTFHIEKGNDCTGASRTTGIGEVVEAWDVTVEVTGPRQDVDLGEIRGSADCHVCFRVTADGPNNYHESDEDDNDFITVYCNPD